MRLRAAAQALARTIIQAGSTVLDESAIDAAAAAQNLDADDLRRAIETHLSEHARASVK